MSANPVETNVVVAAPSTPVKVVSTLLPSAPATAEVQPDTATSSVGTNEIKQGSADIKDKATGVTQSAEDISGRVTSKNAATRTSAGPQPTEAALFPAPEKKNHKKPVADNDVGDDINSIAASRTFLAEVSCRHSRILWLDPGEYDARTSIQGPPSSAPVPIHGVPFPDAAGITPFYAMTVAQHQALRAQQEQFMNLQKQQQAFFAAAAKNTSSSTGVAAPPGEEGAIQPTPDQQFAAQWQAQFLYQQQLLAAGGMMAGAFMMNPTQMAMQQAAVAAAAQVAGTAQPASQYASSQQLQLAPTSNGANTRAHTENDEQLNGEEKKNKRPKIDSVEV